MIRQRPAAAAAVVRGVAENLPFASQAFDAALAVLTVNHWASARAGLAELRRVARRQVVLTWDPEIFRRVLAGPGLPAADRRARRTLACLAVAECELARGGSGLVSREMPVPGDCTDGFLGAYWRRPQAYLDPAIRQPCRASPCSIPTPSPPPSAGSLPI
jgi:hypothetical protein